jgi:hypothetical protein
MADWGPMSKADAKALFIESCYGDKENLHEALKRDRLAVQYEWEIFVDSLCRDEQISMKQYDSWIFPWGV